MTAQTLRCLSPLERLIVSSTFPPTLLEVLHEDLVRAGIPGKIREDYVDKNIQSVSWARAVKVWEKIATEFCKNFRAAVIQDTPPTLPPHPALFILLEETCRSHDASFEMLVRILPLFPSVQGAPTLSCAAKTRKAKRKGNKPKYDEFWNVRPVLQHLHRTPVRHDDEQGVRNRLLFVWRFAHLMRSIDQERIPREHMVRLDDDTFRILVAPKSNGPPRYEPRYVSAVRGAPWWACPLRLLEAYLKLTEDVTQGFLFRYLPVATKSGERKPLTSSRIGSIIKTELRLAGVDVTQFQPHSTRGATISFGLDEKIVDPEEAMAWGNWKSEKVARVFYFRHFRRQNPYARVLQVCKLDKVSPAGAGEDFPLPSPSGVTEHSRSEVSSGEPERKEWEGKEEGEGRGPPLSRPCSSLYLTLSAGSATDTRLSLGQPDSLTDSLTDNDGGAASDASSRSLPSLPTSPPTPLLTSRILESRSPDLLDPRSRSRRRRLVGPGGR